MKDSLIEFLKSASGKSLILSHQNADPDAIASSLLVKNIIKKVNSKLEIDIGAIDSVSRLSNVILSEYDIEILINPPLQYYDCVILVDTSSLNQMGRYAEEFENLSGEKELIIIDHHATDSVMEKIAGIYFTDEKATSTSEVCWALAKEMKLDISNLAEVILCGIISDTGHFRYATKKTFENVVDILDQSKVEYRQVSELLELPKDISIRIAQLKGAQRLQMHKIKGYILATTVVGAYEGVVSRSLLKMGADIAFVSNSKKEKNRISVRARDSVISETGLHLGDMMKELSSSTTGTGGGHTAAAGAKGISDIEDTKKKFLELCKKELVKV